MSVTQLIILIIAGLIAGLLGGTLGVGGGIIVIPTLVLILGFLAAPCARNSTCFYAATSYLTCNTQLLERRLCKLEICADPFGHFFCGRLPWVTYFVQPT